MLGNLKEEKIQQIGENIAQVLTPFEVLENFKKLQKIPAKTNWKLNCSFTCGEDGRILWQSVSKKRFSTQNSDVHCGDAWSPERAVPGTRGVCVCIWILMALIFWFFGVGRAYSIYQAVERAAREGARVYLASTCATCGNTQGDPTAAINRVLMAASLDPAQALVPPPQFNQALVAGNLPNYGQVSGVTVTVTYPFQTGLPMLRFLRRSRRIGTINITATVSMNQEY